MVAPPAAAGAPGVAAPPAGMVAGVRADPVEIGRRGPAAPPPVTTVRASRSVARPATARPGTGRRGRTVVRRLTARRVIGRRGRTVARKVTARRVIGRSARVRLVLVGATGRTVV